MRFIRSFCRPASLLATLSTTLVLAGCFPDPDYSGLPDMSSITVTTRHQSLSLVTAPQRDDSRSQQLMAFLQALPPGAVTRYRVLLPDETNAATYRHWAIALGADPGRLELVTRAPVSSPELAVTAAVASPPDCQSMLIPSSRVNPEHRATFAFGCATRNNLAAMVDDPTDLVTPSRFGGADAAREAGAVDRYENNKTTPLNKTTTLKSN